MDLEQKTDLKDEESLRRVYEMQQDNERQSLRKAIKCAAIVSLVIGIGVPVASRHYAEHEVGLMSQIRDMNNLISNAEDNLFGREVIYYHPERKMLPIEEAVSKATARRNYLVHLMYIPEAFWNDEFLVETGVIPSPSEN